MAMFNPEGLTEQQVARINKKIAEGFTEAQARALAKELRIKNGGGQGKNLAAQPEDYVTKGGVIKEQPTIPAVEEKGRIDFNYNNPDIIGPDGGGREVKIDPVTGKTEVIYKGGDTFDESKSALGGFLKGWANNGPLDLSGMPTVGGIDDYKTGAQAAMDANYNYITKNYGQQKQQEMQAAKQELANRGIPTDPDPNSLYGRTLQQIDQKYQSLDDQAKNQAISKGNETLSTYSGVQSTAADAFLKGATTKHQSDQSDVQLGANLTKAFDPVSQYGPIQGGSNQQGAYLNLLGMISESEAQRLGLAQQWKIAQMQKGGGGGGGGGADTSTPIVGGMAPGFNV